MAGESGVRVFLTLTVLLSIALAARAQYIPPSNGLVAWWRAEGDAGDRAGGHDGTLHSVSFEPGKVGQAFSVAQCPNRIVVPDSDAFRLTNSLSLAAWINPRMYSWHIFTRNGRDVGFDTYTIGLDCVTNFHFVLRGSQTESDRLTVPIALDRWTHVAATLDGISGDMRIYFDGVVVTQKFTTMRAQDIPPEQGPLVGIGNEPFNGSFPFVGLIDELVLYSRALSEAEVSMLAMTGPAVFLQQPSPSNQTAVVGTPASIRARVAGAEPLMLYWCFGANAIEGATNATLTLTNLHVWQSGSYSLAVRNSFGWVMSEPAIINVLPDVLGIDMVPRVALQGELGYSYRLEFINQVGPINAWQLLDNVLITNQPQYYLDFSAIGQPRRFYRIVESATK